MSIVKLQSETCDILKYARFLQDLKSNQFILKIDLSQTISAVEDCYLIQEDIFIKKSTLKLFINIIWKCNHDPEVDFVMKKY